MGKRTHRPMVISFVGAGNLATRLAQALKAQGHQIAGVWSRTRQSAETLARLLQCPWTTDLTQLDTDVDVVFFCVKDCCLEDLAKQVNTSALCVHTAGSMPLDALPQKRRGVLYPMQTFSRQRAVDFSQIPIFLEAEGEEERQTLWQLASGLSRDVTFLTSQQRATLHLAAVFACNFANRCFDIAAELLESQGLSFQSMLPLVDETVRKVHTLSPRQAQTGPAIRWDENVMQKHLDRLEGSNKEIYELMSQSIHKRANE